MMAVGAIRAIEDAGLRCPDDIAVVGFDDIQLAELVSPALTTIRQDKQALGAMYALRMRGVRVPDDIAVVGFDDIEDGRYSTPTLTTISPDKERIARTAVDLLVGRLQGRRSDTSSDVVVDYELVVRESSGGAPTPLEPVPPIPGPTTR
jgi:DNA-binding LacI/PurR family transcriptional regulator